MSVSRSFVNLGVLGAWVVEKSILPRRHEEHQGCTKLSKEIAVPVVSAHEQVTSFANQNMHTNNRI